ncbi:hypothetical protein [Serratia sp. CY76391]|uniref:hypothetical protein n=1 Tax=Serratia sp. CY76391 TaxID=3383681 RepID=UPI003F9F3171
MMQRMVGGGAWQHVAIIAPCSYMRAGLSALMAAMTPAPTVRMWPSVAAWLQDAACVTGQRVSLDARLLLRLPERLGPLLEALEFLRMYLRRQSQEGRRSLRGILLLTDVPKSWLYDTLRRLVKQESSLEGILVLPACSQPSSIARALAGRIPSALLTAPGGRCLLSGLCRTEVRILVGFLVYGVSIQAQAHLSGVSPKTCYSQRQSAMKKFGVLSALRLARWGAREWQRVQY